MSATKRILYIEDDRDNREMIGMILGARDTWTMLEADTGQAGITLAQNSHVDVILLDISLPDISGHDVLSKLKDNARTKDIPVIGLSGICSDEDVFNARESGFINYLPKPVNMQALYNAIEEVL